MAAIKKGPSLLLMALAVSSCMSFRSGAELANISVLELSGLKNKCHLERRWMGIVPSLSWSAWLVCRDSAVLVVHPWNLIGNVSITRPHQALEYVRLFTSYRTFGMFSLEGLLEVRPVDADWLDLLAKSPGVAERFHAPEVTELEKESGLKRFQIRRVAVDFDQEVFEITEIVREDGFYSIESEDLILRDIRELGFLHRAI